ncbi:MAG: DUF4214 domain-containing protein [Lachnospiraceae bacterium]|nr:DUF4214 domain-containing protein [Lachnospiraceae bacterium]
MAKRNITGLLIIAVIIVLLNHGVKADAAGISDNTISVNELEAERRLTVESDIIMQPENTLGEEAGNFIGDMPFFEVVDARNGNRFQVNPQENIGAIYIFGGIGSCLNTTNTLEVIDWILDYADTRNINIYAFDIQGNDDESIRSAAGSMNVKIHMTGSVPNQESLDKFQNFFNRSMAVARNQGTINGNSFTMPLIVCKNAGGEVIKTSTGSLNTFELLEILKCMGASYDMSLMNFTTTGRVDYQASYEVLDMVNAERAKKGLPALVMDQELLEAAMLRAAECYVYYSHTRPDGTAFHTVGGKLADPGAGENIMTDLWTDTPQGVMEQWFASPEDYANITNASYRSTGIAVFDGTTGGGGRCWVQCFSTAPASAADRPEQLTKTVKTYNINGLRAALRPYIYVYDTNSCIRWSRLPSYALEAGRNYLFAIEILNEETEHKARVDADCFTWNFSNEAVAGESMFTTLYPPNSRALRINIKGSGETTVNAVNNSNAGVILKAEISVTGDGGNIENTLPDQIPERGIEDFVKRMYIVALNREAEEAGFKDWCNRLSTQQIDGAGIAQGFIGSVEFANRDLDDDEFLDVLYRTFFDREADIEGKLYWSLYLWIGGSRQEVLCGFVNSQEFSNLSDSFGIARGTLQENGSSIYNPGVRNFVLRMYTKALNRNGETMGVEDWTNRINTGIMSAETVAKSFFGSEEFLNRRLSDADYVETLYQTFMDRTSDEEGKRYWINKLNNGMSREQVLEGFSRSVEFGEIMKKYGL